MSKKSNFSTVYEARSLPEEMKSIELRWMISASLHRGLVEYAWNFAKVKIPKPRPDKPQYLGIAECRKIQKAIHTQEISQITQEQFSKIVAKTNIQEERPVDPNLIWEFGEMITRSDGIYYTQWDPKSIPKHDKASAWLRNGNCYDFVSFVGISSLGKRWQKYKADHGIVTLV